MSVQSEAVFLLWHLTLLEFTALLHAFLWPGPFYCECVITLYSGFCVQHGLCFNLRPVWSCLVCRYDVRFGVLVCRYDVRFGVLVCRYDVRFGVLVCRYDVRFGVM